MKILHLPSSVGGLNNNLSQGEQFLGFDSKTLVAFKNWLNYPADINLNLDTKEKCKAIFALIKTFINIRKKYDVFHFNFGSSLLHFPSRNLFHLELPFYPKSAKKFVTYAGCDARQKYPTMRRAKIAACHNVNCYKGQCNSGALDKQRRQGIDKMALHVDHIWAYNPDLLFFLPPEKSSFLPYSVNQQQFSFQPVLSIKYPIKILHAPTDRELKGSKFIIHALENLKRKYPEKIEVLFVENTPHLQAIELYKTADLVIDQLLIGWYGVFAVEAMMMGKPVIARIDEECLQFLPTEMAKDLSASIINANPFTLEFVLEKYINDKDLLLQQGLNGYYYSMKWHDNKKVAQITTKRYIE